MCKVVFFSAVFDVRSVVPYISYCHKIFLMRINSLLGITVYILHISKEARTVLWLTGIAFKS